MLKFAISGALLLLVSTAPSYALCTSYPNTLTNGTTADGGQVMANFNCAALTSGSTINGLTLTGTTVFPGSTTISSSGLVGIGTTPSNILDISQSQNAASSLWLTNNNTGGSAQARLIAGNGTNAIAVGNLGQNYSSSGIYQAGGGYVETNTSLTLDGYAGPLVFATIHTEAGRFGTDGSFLVGTTINGGWSTSAKLASVASNAVAISAQTTGSSGGSAIYARVENTISSLTEFYYQSTKVGSITTTGSATAYNTSSDARLKVVRSVQTNYQPIIRNLWVGDFDWKKSHAHGFGILAQQTYPLFPDAVTKPDSAAGQWQADYGKLAPLALWGVKDLYRSSDNQNARISALEHEISALRRVNDSDQAEIRQLKAQISLANNNKALIGRLLTQVSELQQRAGIRAASN